MPLETFPFDGSRHLDNPESQRELLAEAAESGDPRYLAHAVELLAKSLGIDAIATRSGISRERLYDLLTERASGESLMGSLIDAWGGSPQPTKDAA